MSREQIIWIASYPKSGNTWVRYLLTAYYFDEPPEWRTCDRFVLSDRFLAAAQDDQQRWSEIRAWADNHASGDGDVDRPILHKTHYAWSDRHPLASRTKAVVHLTRHPLSVAQSALNHTLWAKETAAWTEKDYLERFLEFGGDPKWAAAGFGTWEEHERTWLQQSEHPHLLVRYEDLHAKPASELQRMLEFLGFDVEASRVERAVEWCRFENLKSLEQQQKRGGKMQGRSPNRHFFHRGKPLDREASDAELVNRFETRFANLLRQLGRRAGEQRHDQPRAAAWQWPIGSLLRRRSA